MFFADFDPFPGEFLRSENRNGHSFFKGYFSVVSTRVGAVPPKIWEIWRKSSLSDAGRFRRVPKGYLWRRWWILMSPESIYKPVEKLGVGDNRPPQFGQMSEKSVSSHYGATVCRIFDPFSDFVHWQKPTSDFCHGHQGSPQLFPKFGENEKNFGCSFF